MHCADLVEFSEFGTQQVDYTTNLFLGGPVLRDKLWFFTSFEHVEIAVERIRLCEVARRIDAVVSARIHDGAADGVRIAAIEVRAEGGVLLRLRQKRHRHHREDVGRLPGSGPERHREARREHRSADARALDQRGERVQATKRESLRDAGRVDDRLRKVRPHPQEMHAVEAEVLHAAVGRHETAEAFPRSGCGPVRADRPASAVLGTNVHAVGALKRHGAIAVLLLRERFPLARLNAIRDQRVAPFEAVEASALFGAHE